MRFVSKGFRGVGLRASVAKGYEPHGIQAQGFLLAPKESGTVVLYFGLNTNRNCKD